MLTHNGRASTTMTGTALEVGADSVATGPAGRTLSSTTLVIVTKYAVCGRLTHCPLQGGSCVAVQTQAPFWQVDPAGHYKRVLLLIEAST
jgi:hypothetical protein